MKFDEKTFLTREQLMGLKKGDRVVGWSADADGNLIKLGDAKVILPYDGVGMGPLVQYPNRRRERTSNLTRR